MPDSFPAFIPTARTGPGPFSANDVADCEAYIARQLGERTGSERQQIERFLRRNPGQSIRDWKGKGDPDYISGSQSADFLWCGMSRDDFEKLATEELARCLPADIRVWAANNPELIWNPLARRYRLRQPSDPMPDRGHEKLSHPVKATGGGVMKTNSNREFDLPLPPSRAERG